MFLSSDTTYLRALEPSDLEFLYALENDIHVWHIGNTTTPYSKYVLEQYLENAAQDIYTIKQLRLIICTKNGEPIGAIDLFDFDPLHNRAGVGIIIAPPYRGKGHATEALDLLMEYSRNVLHMHLIYCSVTATNLASIQLFKKAGFSETGIRKEWLRKADGWDDVVELQKLL
jgi:diamine N-acetyltransferase